MKIFDTVNKSVCKIGNLLKKQVNRIGNGHFLFCLCISGFTGLIILLNKSFVTKLPTSQIYITNESPKFVDPSFLSLGLDSSVITNGFEHFNMTDPKLMKMMGHLAPAYLRIGGNQADQIIFCKDNQTENCLSKYKNTLFNASESFVLLGSDWLKLNQLATSANIMVIYDLNSLLRFENGSWNPENADDMFRFSSAHNLKLNWELGNEPNDYKHKFNTSVDASQLAADYFKLKQTLSKYELYEASFLIGPSTTRLRTKEVEKYFAEFLLNGSLAVKGITWHHYYFSGINATAKQFLDANVFNYLSFCIEQVTSIVRDFMEIDKPIWLGETSSAWHAGAPNLSDRYISSFIWLDKLGLSAQMGIDVVVRQSIFKGHYALLDNSYDPNPDWWISVLYKKLVGTTVLKTEYKMGNNKTIRLYAHCAKEGNSAVVVFGVNIEKESVFVKIENIKSTFKVHVYEITSESSLFSKYVRLNGEVLKLKPNLDLPDLKPKIVEKTAVYLMPAYSIVFWVFNHTYSPIC